MIIDSELQFSGGGIAGQSLNGFGVTTTALTNVIDSGPLGGQVTAAPSFNAGRDFGMGHPLWLYLLWIAAPTAAGAATLDAQVVSSAAQALTSTNIMLDITGGPLVVGTSPKLASGVALRVDLPRAGTGFFSTTGWLRFIGVNFIVTGAALTGGVVNCFLSLDLQDSLIYAAGYLVQ